MDLLADIQDNHGFIGAYEYCHAYFVEIKVVFVVSSKRQVGAAIKSHKDD